MPSASPSTTALRIRNLDDRVKERLRVRAARHGRSMEAEVRAILADAVAAPGEARACSRRSWTASANWAASNSMAMPRADSPARSFLVRNPGVDRRAASESRSRRTLKGVVFTFAFPPA